MTPTTLPQRTVTDLHRLTSLRALAALTVFIFHVGTHTDWLPYDRYARYGFTGVGFFFILSGFVLTWAWRPHNNVRTFYVRRFARIYPTYAVMGLLALLVPVTVFEVTGAGTAANLGLVQAWVPRPDVAFALNGVSWSLSCEAFFYLFAPFLIRGLAGRSHRLVLAVCLPWVVLTASVALVLAFQGPRADLTAFTNPAVRSGEFVLGMMLATLVASGWRPRWRLGSASALLLVLGFVLSRWVGTLPHGAADVALTPLFALLIASAATADLHGAPGWLRHRTLHYLGEVSFAFYLVHELVIVNLAAVVGTETGPGSRVLALGVFLLSLGLAMLLHELVEKPGQRWVMGQRRSRIRTPVGVQVPVAA